MKEVEKARRETPRSSTTRQNIVDLNPPRSPHPSKKVVSGYDRKAISRQFRHYGRANGGLTASRGAEELD
jgi:hypothetical protein